MTFSGCPTIDPLLHCMGIVLCDPSLNPVCRSTIWFPALEQLKVVPLHTVLVPPITVHMNVSISPGQAHPVLEGCTDRELKKNNGVSVVYSVFLNA